jgi:L,D-transpeptidase ErfK/SrfK
MPVATISVSVSEKTLTLTTPDAERVFRVAVPRHSPTRTVEGNVREVQVGAWWYPTEKTRASYKAKYDKELRSAIPPGDPQNAMGAGKVIIDFVTSGADPAVRIHGTNLPDQIGLAVSRGCIRMLDEDFLTLAQEISGIATTVTINP